MNHGLFGATLALAVLAGAAARADAELADKATGAVYVLSAGDAGTMMLVNKTDGEMDSYKLEPNCYATHPIYGLGAWQAVEGGWRIMVGGTQIVAFDGATPLDNPACVPQ
jgi:hypothetical protein